MAQLITRIRTESGDLQIDYNALANLPDTPTPESIGASPSDHKHTVDEIGAAPADHTHELESLGAASDSEIKELLNNKSDSNHEHNYAGSSTPGGAAASANKINTDAGDSVTPVYFSNGVPVECSLAEMNTATATKLAAPVTIQMNLSSSSATDFDGSENVTPGVTGVLPIENGGIGSSDGAVGLSNLFAAGVTVLSANQFGTSLPSAGTAGRVFFKKVST
jgi:hypothetical protein